MLTYEELQAITSHVELRLPGNWKMRVYLDSFLGPHVRFTATVPDTRHTEQPVRLGINSRIPPYDTAHDFLRWLEHRWVEIWVHEAREGFWWYGSVFDDPHKAPAITGRPTVTYDPIILHTDLPLIRTWLRGWRLRLRNRINRRKFTFEP